MSKIPRWAPVELHWHDAHGGDDKWLDIDEIDARPELVVSVGQLLKRDASGVTIVMSRLADRGNVISDYLYVPTVSIIKLKELHGK